MKIHSIDAIREAIRFYVKGWRHFIVAFLLVFIVTSLFSFLLSKNFIGSIMGFFYILMTLFKSQITTIDQEKLALFIVVCIGVISTSLLVTIVPFLIGILISLSVLKPFDDMVSNKSISSWKKFIFPNIKNCLKVSLIRIIFIVPLWFILFIVPSLLLYNYLQTSAIGGFGTTKNLGQAVFVFLIIVLLFVITLTIVTIFVDLTLAFLEIEVVMKNLGIIKATKNSISLLRRNFLNVLILNLPFWIINLILVGFLFIPYLGSILQVAIIWLLVQPIFLLSKLILWKKITVS